VGMGTTGALGWNLCLDEKNGPQNGFKVGDQNGGCTACRGMVKIDFSRAQPSIHFNPEFRALEQVSKFVRRGARRIGVRGEIEGLQAVAFRNPDGRLVFVAHNLTGAALPFQLRDGGGRALDYVLGASDAVTLSWNP
jgi:glucosylceramidase